MYTFKQQKKKTNKNLTLENLLGKGAKPLMIQPKEFQRKNREGTIVLLIFKETFRYT